MVQTSAKAYLAHESIINCTVGVQRDRYNAHCSTDDMQIDSSLDGAGEARK